MKKLLCLVLFLMLACFSFVGCGEEEIGKIPDDYPEIDNEIEEVSLNLYIIVEDETVSNGKTKAINTVNNAIKQYTSSEFRSEVNVVYVTAAEYNTKVLAAVNATDSTAANIVLVNSKALFNDLYATGKLVNLNSFIDSKAYGRLNTEIPVSLIDASKVTEQRADGSTADILYTIPNNRVIGSYEYLIINKERSRFYNVNDEKCLSYKSIEDANELVEKIESYGQETVADVISVVTGAYEDKAKYEAEGYFCNVVSYPVVSDDFAFASAFAIINKDALHNERAMEIIYNINVDVELRNLLQYGVKGTNYNEEIEFTDSGERIESTLNVVRDDSENNIYHMNLMYTGNVFKAYSCDEINWDNTAKENGIHQNNDADDFFENNK